MSLAKKLAEVAREVSYVQKDGANAFHKYRYASAAAVLEKVNQAFSSRNIATFPSVDVLENVTVATKQGEARLVTVRVKVRLVDGETGETDTLEGLGSGSDNGDKAVMKAQTAGIKYAYMLGFSISTGDDPEADASTDEATSAAPQRAPVESVTAPKRDAAPSPGYDSSLTMRFGPAKGVPISDMGPQDLAFYINAAERGIADPSKAQWKANTEKQLAALRAEYTKRLGADATDDNIPY
jgi:hypothetical protein